MLALQEGWAGIKRRRGGVSGKEKEGGRKDGRGGGQNKKKEGRSVWEGCKVRY